MDENKYLEKTINALFSMKKETIFLILIFLLGLALRLIAAINLPVTADDMHHVTYAINFYSAGRLITYEQSAGLWHAFTSVMYDWFGTTQLASRLAAVIFGSLSIFVIYLLTKEFFSEKIPLMASFLLAIAPFHIKNTVAEMDVMAMFFVLVSMLLFVRALKTKKTLNYIMSGLFLGLGIYTKTYPLLFVPSFLLYFVYIKRKNKEKIITRENSKKIILFLAVAAVFAVPTLTHNYLLYKDKGFLDLHFTRTLGLGRNISEQYYGFDAAFYRTSSWAGLFFGDTRHIVSGVPLLLGAADFIRKGDPIVFYLGLLGILFTFVSKKDKDYLFFLLFSILFILPFLAANILLAKHYLFLELFLIPLGALFLDGAGQKISQTYKVNAVKIFVVVLLIASLILLGLPATGISHFYGESHISQMIQFKDKNIPKTALIVADSRMYRGRINWAFQGRPYLEGIDFMNLANSKDQLSGEDINVETYFFECVPDDCGWGTVKDQPDFNASMESLADFFKKNGVLVAEFEEPVRSEVYYPFIAGAKEKVVNVYKSELMLKSSVIGIASQPKNWWIYDIGYLPKEKQFDYYITYNSFDTLLNKIAHWIVTLALVLTFLSPIYVIYLIIKK
ncbi:glycosyltransferase family 39 protein [Candidatus Pacearchaeota archaeon]|nr:glycosyltransferase family 39 protein [Candidatus Pacearchaeota archaeon]